MIITCHDNRFASQSIFRVPRYHLGPIRERRARAFSCSLRAIELLDMFSSVSILLCACVLFI